MSHLHLLTCLSSIFPPCLKHGLSPSLSILLPRLYPCCFLPFLNFNVHLNNPGNLFKCQIWLSKSGAWPEILVFTSSQVMLTLLAKKHWWKTLCLLLVKPSVVSKQRAFIYHISTQRFTHTHTSMMSVKRDRLSLPAPYHQLLEKGHQRSAKMLFLCCKRKASLISKEKEGWRFRIKGNGESA